jgi:hypothetical protein
MTPKPAPMCACGKPLHYRDTKTQALVQLLVDSLGEMIKVECGSRLWLVPRHYIALHGLSPIELPFLGFEEVMTDA